jgi:hypothetical protein
VPELKKVYRHLTNAHLWHATSYSHPHISYPSDISGMTYPSTSQMGARAQFIDNHLGKQCII